MPWAGPVPSAKVFGSPATRVASPPRSPATWPFSATVAGSDAALIGVGATVSVTVAVEAWPEPSVTVYVKVSVPLKPVAGVYV